MKFSLKRSSAVIVGLILSVPLAIFGFFAYQTVSTRASDAQPRDVVISTITESSARVKWTTDQPTQGVIEYGTSPTSLVFFAPEAEKSKDHSVELTLLTPNTTHYFQLRIADTTYDNGGVPWTFTTKSVGEAADDETSTGSPQPTKATGESGSNRSSPSPTKATAKPTDLAEKPTKKPTKKPEPTEEPEENVCDGDNCARILQQLSKGCTSADYIRCLNRENEPTPKPTDEPEDTPTPTEEPEPTNEPDDE